MKKIPLYFICLLTVCMLYGCDDHDVIDLSYHPGHLLCADGQAVSLQDYLSQGRNDAVGVLFSSEQEGGRYLAVLLDELAPMAFSDSLGFVQGTSADEAALDGFANTTSLQNTADAATGHGSPLGDATFARHFYGQSDYVPSVGELRLLYKNRHLVNEVIRQLPASAERCVPLSFTGDGCWYWSSTEVSGNQGNQAWLFSMSSGTIHPTPKTEAHPARIIVAYYLSE